VAPLGMKTTFLVNHHFPTGDRQEENAMPKKSKLLILNIVMAFQTVSTMYQHDVVMVKFLT
jgi:hypothetical protein